MKMNRRNVLIGLGTVVAGGGAALGTGAFSSVEAQRTVDIETAGDASALLAFEDGGSQFAGVDGDDLIEIDQDNLNKDALTRADGAIEVTNNGENNVGFYAEWDGDALDVEVDDGSIEGSDNSTNLETGDGNSIELDLVFDLQGDNDEDDLPDEITFHAVEDEFED